jgi:hypothetical protein
VTGADASLVELVALTDKLLTAPSSAKERLAMTHPTLKQFSSFVVSMEDSVHNLSLVRDRLEAWYEQTEHGDEELLGLVEELRQKVSFLESDLRGARRLVDKQAPALATA